MSALEIECPSGLIVKARELIVEDEDLLSDPKALKRGTATTDLLNAITIECVNPGPYNFKDGNLNWRKVLQGDRLATILKVRIETFGVEYSYRTRCAKCKSRHVIQIDLNDLELQKLPETSLGHARDARETLSTVLPKCGKRVEFILLRGSDDAAMAKLQKQNKNAQSSSYLRYRIRGIEGVNEPDWKSFLKKLSMRDSSFLRQAFEKADCGVNQSIEVDCNECDHWWIDEVAFTADFLFPKYQEKNTTTE